MDRIDFQAGHILLIDKPLRWTSFDVVNKLRYALKRKLGVKKIKVGHAGTLDPLATGLLVICIGKATKTINELQADSKTYTGTITLGGVTPSYDLESDVSETFSTEHITSAGLEEASAYFTGTYDQCPPMFSAKKVDGQVAYLAARKGKTVDLKAVPVSINRFEITRAELPEVDFLVDCSKGTYIRSLAHDFGRKLESGGYLSALRRTRSGAFSIDDALSIEEAVKLIEENPDPELKAE